MLPRQFPDARGLRLCDLAAGAGEHAHILGGDIDLAALDLAPAGDHAVGRRAFAQRIDLAAREHAKFLERPRVEQQVEALPRIELACRLEPVERVGAAELAGCRAPCGKVLQDRLVHACP